MPRGKKDTFYTIGNLAKLTGLTPRTIRYYEELELLDSIKRIEAGRRAYTDDDLRRLKFIKRLKLLGLTLAEIKELGNIYKIHRTNKKVLPRLLELLDSHVEETDKRIKGLMKLRVEIHQYKKRIKKKLTEIQE